MSEQSFDSYKLSWEVLNVFMEGASPLEFHSFMGQLKDEDQVAPFLTGYGFDVENPIHRAELFGTYQESMQFIKRFMLKEGNPEGIDLQMPQELSIITDIKELLILATKVHKDNQKVEVALWAGIILKVMHTFLHADKDLRHRYFSAIQTQILDRLYRYIHRSEDGALFLGTPKEKFQVPLTDFQTKSKKTRESIIIKLLHKKENVAEELFDRIGVRFITKNKFDALRVIKFLVDHYITIPHNIKPSRSINTLVDMKRLPSELQKLYKEANEKKLSPKEYYLAAQKITENCIYHGEKALDNKHSLKEYRAIHFTYRQLVKYTNPFMYEFTKVKNWAKENKDNPASAMILKLDTSTISRDVTFFYPFEVQVTDHESHAQNTLGEASHHEYKTAQIRSAINRIFRPLIELKKIDF
jgi:uncharacterized protein (TIGR04562 family)